MAETIFHRKIEFLAAKKQCSKFSNSGDFKLETLNPTTSDQTTKQHCVTDNLGSSNQIVVMKKTDHFNDLPFDPELSFGFTMRRIGAGLENLGNTCFLNSVLQCLTYTQPLAAYLQSGKHKSSCRKAGFCALCAIQNHVSRALQATGRSLAPKDLVSNLRCISRNFRNARQEDAHEYMVNLLESMHKCCLPSGVPSESPSAFEKSLVHKIFGGRLRSQVKCTQCSFCSDKFDPFLDLSLEINNADSLQKALAHFTAKEYLDGGAREYQCQKCKQKVKALKQLSIYKAPNVLNIHLKRFGCHQPGQKINKKVHFGPTLDLKPFVTGAHDGDLKYTLYGVLVHYGGSTHSGHYYCFVRTTTGVWYSLDDHRVGNVSEKRVLEEKAYMLFYVRDQKNVIPKKPVDVGRAQNMIINAMGGNKMQSNSSQVLKTSFQNGPSDKIMESLHPSPALTQVDVAVTGALRETLTKGKPIQGTVAASSSTEKKVQLNTSIVKDDVTRSSNGGDCSTQSTVANGPVANLDNGPFGANGNKISMAKNTNDTPSALVVVSPNNKCLQNSVKNNCSSEVAKTPKNNQKAEINMSDSLGINSQCNGNHSSSVDLHAKDTTPLKGCDEKRSKIVDPSSQVEELSHENIQIGGSSKESTSVDSSKEMELTGLKSSSTPAPGKASVLKSKRKLKKKLSKRQFPMTRLSSDIMLGAALSSRKKIKKKVKRSALKIDILAQEHLGPSTSELSRPLAIMVDSRKKKLKPSLRKSKNISTAKNVNESNCILEKGVIDEKLRNGVGQNDDVSVAADKATQNIPSSSLAGNGTVSRISNTLKESTSDLKQSGIMNKLTGGLGETLVPRWDETQRPSSHITGRTSGKPVSIGYIGDDWDEEYDMGKRKKVRTSITEFGGPNPFQEIVTQKAKFKKAKFHHSSSVNQPFGI